MATTVSFKTGSGGLSTQKQLDVQTAARTVPGASIKAGPGFLLVTVPGRFSQSELRRSLLRSTQAAEALREIESRRQLQPTAEELAAGTSLIGRGRDRQPVSFELPGVRAAPPASFELPSVLEARAAAPAILEPGVVATFELPGILATTQLRGVRAPEFESIFGARPPRREPTITIPELFGDIKRRISFELEPARIQRAPERITREREFEVIVPPGGGEFPDLGIAFLGTGEERREFITRIEEKPIGGVISAPEFEPTVPGQLARGLVGVGEEFLLIPSTISTLARAPKEPDIAKQILGSFADIRREDLGANIFDVSAPVSKEFPLVLQAKAPKGERQLEQFITSIGFLGIAAVAPKIGRIREVKLPRGRQPISLEAPKILIEPTVKAPAFKILAKRETITFQKGPKVFGGAVIDVSVGKRVSRLPVFFEIEKKGGQFVSRVVGAPKERIGIDLTRTAELTGRGRAVELGRPERRITISKLEEQVAGLPRQRRLTGQRVGEVETLTTRAIQRDVNLLTTRLISQTRAQSILPAAERRATILGTERVLARVTRPGRVKIVRERALFRGRLTAEPPRDFLQRRDFRQRAVTQFDDIDRIIRGGRARQRARITEPELQKAVGGFLRQIELQEATRLAARELPPPIKAISQFPKVGGKQLTIKDVGIRVRIPKRAAAPIVEEEVFGRVPKGFELEGRVSARGLKLAPLVSQRETQGIIQRAGTKTFETSLRLKPSRVIDVGERVTTGIRQRPAIGLGIAQVSKQIQSTSSMTQQLIGRQAARPILAREALRPPTRPTTRLAARGFIVPLPEEEAPTRRKKKKRIAGFRRVRNPVGDILREVGI